MKRFEVMEPVPEVSGSAHVSRATGGAPAIANFHFEMQPAPPDSFAIKDCFGATPKPGRRGDRYLIS